MQPDPVDPGAAPGGPQRVLIEVDGTVLARGLVDAAEPVVRIQLDVAGGHLPPNTRSELVGAVFDLVDPGEARTVEVAVPAGDTELIALIGARTTSLHSRAAGATCLIEATIPVHPLP